MPSTIPAATPSPSGASQERDTAPSSLARDAAADAATRARSASSSERLPSPAISTLRRPPPGASSWVTATLRRPGFASPRSTSDWSAGSESDSSSKSGTTRVSAAVSSGDPGRAETRTGAKRGRV